MSGIRLSRSTPKAVAFAALLATALLLVACGSSGGGDQDRGGDKGRNENEISVSILRVGGTDGLRQQSISVTGLPLSSLDQDEGE